jgi:hypothetical protein
MTALYERLAALAQAGTIRATRGYPFGEPATSPSSSSGPCSAA